LINGPEDTSLDRADECAICLDPLGDSGPLCALPCSHKFHAACVEGLRSFGIKQMCPICRVDLPPCPEQTFEEATRRYFDVQRRVDRGKASWGALTKTKQREMDEVLRLWRSAAEQGHADAHHNLGVMCANGQGVKRDHAEAVRWYWKAAERGHANAQYNLGLRYANGQGVKHDHAEAVRWFQKAAEQGHARFCATRPRRKPRLTIHETTATTDHLARHPFKHH